jgi:2-methylcitrate dehydratase PrpD
MMEDALSPTQRLGRHAARMRHAQLPAGTMRKAAYCLLDAFGLAIVASAERTFRAFLETCSPIGAGTGRGRLWHGGSWHTLAEAVEGNAILAHAHFHDDSEYSSWSHPASLIVPVATTLGDSTGASVDRVLRAIVAGYSAINWLGAEETVALAMIHRGVRTSPTLGAIAAAASASVLLDLGAEQSASAAGIAASITGGLLEPVRTGSDEWRVQNAHAARAGLLAAQLAGGGVRGARSALEGPKGLLAAYAGMNALPDRWKSDPDPQTIVSHVVAKPYATLGDNMAAAIAAKLLFEDGVDIDAIAGIRVSLWRHYYEYPGTSYRGPFDETAQALASTVFAVAAMLVCGELEFDINRDRREDPRILRLAALTEVEPDDVGNAEDSVVEITFKDGSRRSRNSREGARTLLYHDDPTALALIGRRFSASGIEEKRGTAFGQGLLDGAGTLRTLLDRVFDPA